MADLDLSEFHEMYMNGVNQQMEQMGAALLTLETTPSNTEARRQVFLAAHAIKGSSWTMKYDAPAALSESIEAQMIQVNEHGAPFHYQAIYDLFAQLQQQPAQGDGHRRARRQSQRRRGYPAPRRQSDARRAGDVRLPPPHLPDLRPADEHRAAQ